MNEPSNITFGDYESLGFGEGELETIADNVSFVETSDGHIAVVRGSDKAVLKWKRVRNDDFLSRVDRGLKARKHYLTNVNLYDPQRKSGAIISGTLKHDISLPYVERPGLTLEDIAREIAERNA